MAGSRFNGIVVLQNGFTITLNDRDLTAAEHRIIADAVDLMTREVAERQEARPEIINFIRDSIKIFRAKGLPQSYEQLIAQCVHADYAKNNVYHGYFRDFCDAIGVDKGNVGAWYERHKRSAEIYAEHARLRNLTITPAAPIRSVTTTQSTPTEDKIARHLAILTNELNVATEAQKHVDALISLVGENQELSNIAKTLKQTHAATKDLQILQQAQEILSKTPVRFPRDKSTKGV